MSKERKSRNKIDKSKFDLLKPIDVLSMGSDDDPCFGKHYDLLAKECRMCGDSEFCAIVKSQNLKIDNLLERGDQKFKDIEEAKLVKDSKIEKAKVLIDKYKKQGLRNTKILLKVWGEIKLPKDKIKELLK